MNRLLSIPMMACYVILMAGAPQVALSCDAKCEAKLAKSAAKLEKKIKKTAARYEKAIVKAETKGCKVRPIITTAEKTCARSMKAIDTKYTKFKDEVKAHASIKPLKKRHDDLNNVLAGFRQQIAVSKITNTFTQMIIRMEEYCTKGGEQTTCKKLSAQAMAQYDGFSSEIQKSNDVKSKLQKRDEYMAKSTKLEAEYKERNANLAASNAASSLYVQTVGKVKDVLKMLRAGRDNNADAYFSYLTLPKKLSSEIKEFKNNCEGPFKSVTHPVLDEGASAAAKHAAKISAASTSSSNYPARIQEACELMANYDKYLATARVNLSNKHYDAEVLRLSNNIKGLKENGKTYHGTFSTLSYGFDDYKDKFRDDTSSVSLSMDRFDDVHDDFEDALKVALKMNDWDDVVGDDMNDGFEKSIKGYAKRHDLDFEKGAYRKDNTIYISKNGLGIPENKYTHGYVMLKHDDESHYRMYNVTFYFDYLGGGQYAAASSVKFKDLVMPVSD